MTPLHARTSTLLHLEFCPTRRRQPAQREALIVTTTVARANERQRSTNLPAESTTRTGRRQRVRSDGTRPRCCGRRTDGRTDGRSRGIAGRRCLCPIKRRRRTSAGETPRDRFAGAGAQLSLACRPLPPPAWQPAHGAPAGRPAGDSSPVVVADWFMICRPNDATAHDVTRTVVAAAATASR